MTERVVYQVPAPRRYLSYKGLKDKLDVGTSKAYEILGMFQAQGKAVKIGNCLRVREEFVDSWLEELEGEGGF